MKSCAVTFPRGVSAVNVLIELLLETKVVYCMEEGMEVAALSCVLWQALQLLAYFDVRVNSDRILWGQS